MFQIISTIFVILIGIHIYNDAMRHGYGVFFSILWALAAMFFPLALFVYYGVRFFKSKKKTTFTSDVKPQVGAAHLCPKCGEEFFGNPQKCDSCGNQLAI